MRYVGYAYVGSQTDLLKLLPAKPLEQSKQPKPPESFFFLRWRHKVSGILVEQPETLSPEGQWFTANGELRWKPHRQGYQILWLGHVAPSSVESLKDLEFTPVKRSWQTEDHAALLHDRRTPQYPHLFRYPSRLQNRIQQRYFRDGDTGTVHFIALTVRPPQSPDASPKN